MKEVDLMKGVLLVLMISSMVFGLIVNPVKNLREDFIFGMDVSMLYEIEQLGGKYFENGVEKDCLEILKNHGINWIRLRVWNDPRDENGNPLGGGNCDYLRMTEIAKRAKKLGMKVLLDFHYSDWWADPGKQNKPKEWEYLHGELLERAVYSYTKLVLNHMRRNGALPDMVQVGNEVNNGFLWPDGKISGEGAGGFDGFTRLLKAAIKAVREVDPDIKIVIHLAEGGNNSLFRWFFDEITRRNVDFDVIGVSYYPYWHGTLEDLKNNLYDIATRYNKDVLVVETAYAWTLEDGDGYPNIFNGEEMELTGGYKATVQGQATFLRDLMEVVNSVPNGHGLGIFYWEGDWIPVRGAGWKTGEGNPWDNQAMFDFSGNALPSLNVFKLVKTSSPVEIAIKEILPVEVTTNLGEVPKFPDAVKVLFSDDSIRSLPVEWNFDSALVEESGVYKVEGYIKDIDRKIFATLTVKGSRNYLKNPGFETGEFSPWQVSGDKKAVKVVKVNPSSNAHQGEYAVNFWLDESFSFELSQEVELPAGVYRVGFWTHGEKGVKIALKVSDYGGDERSVEVETTGWLEWKNPEIRNIKVETGRIKITVSVEGRAGDWGFIDDFYLFREE